MPGAVGRSDLQIPEADWDQPHRFDAWGHYLGNGLVWSKQPHRIWGMEKPQEDGPAAEQGIPAEDGLQVRGPELSNALQSALEAVIGKGP